jgi:ribulose-phosphate 3-epimerase
LDAQLPKLERIAERREQRGLDFLLEIDGGINLDTARKAISAGAEVLVAGTAIFGEEDRARALAQLRKAAAG